MAAILELRKISKRFPAHLAVDNISLLVEGGSFFSLLGPSGCGKTTVLRMIAGLEQVTSGEVLLNGNRIDELRPYQRNVSTVFQNYALFPHLTVGANIEFGLQRKGKRENAAKIREMLELVRLTGKEGRYPAQLSGGERQRVALARSLALEPAVLLLDEPLSALDPNLRKQVRAELKELQRRVGVTFVFVTHDQEEALSLSDRMAVMNGGRLEQGGTPEELYTRPKSRFVAAFLGDVNWIGQTGIRPESLRISREIPLQQLRTVHAVVEKSTFLGNCFQVQAKLHSGESIVVEVPRTPQPFQPGEAVHMWWHAKDELPPIAEA